ncbi:MAG: ABC transporter substrate-binding protein [Deltaproteobacteria bacterium]|nr:ABC transporter substrate-binding protein [Deltaproteobacteria bacterium]
MELGKIRLLCSDISHMALLSVFRDSGVPQKHGFDLEVDVATISLGGRAARGMKDRAKCLLEGDYEFLSGLHHETYIYRAKGDKRFVYLGQAQNDWDDRLIARPEFKTAKDLEGKRILTNQAPCVGGNLDHSLALAGVDTSKVEFVYQGRDLKVTERGTDALEKLIKGELDAANVDIPFDYLGKKKGLHTIQLPSVPVIHNTTICASTDFTLKNEEKVFAFLKAFIESVHFFKTEKQKVCEILSRELGPMIHVSGDDEIEYIHKQWSDLLSKKPYPHPMAVWNVYNLDVAHDPKINFIGPFEIWDTHYLREIDDSGFIDALYN